MPLERRADEEPPLAAHFGFKSYFKVPGQFKILGPKL
jgi:hypothetical protein